MIANVILLSLLAAAPQDEALLVRSVQAPQQHPEFVSALSRAVESSVIAIYEGEVVTPQAVATAIERDQGLQCIDDSTSCMSELAEALGVALVLRTQVVTLGTTRVVTFSLIEADSAKVRAQITERVAASDDEIFRVIDELLPTLFGQKPVRPPNPLLKWGLIGTGSVVLLGGGTAMTYTLLQSRSYNDGSLSAEDATKFEDREVLLWAVSGIALATGAAMVVTGLFVVGE